MEFNLNFAGCIVDLDKNFAKLSGATLKQGIRHMNQHVCKPLILRMKCKVEPRGWIIKNVNGLKIMIKKLRGGECLEKVPSITRDVIN